MTTKFFDCFTQAWLPLGIPRGRLERIKAEEPPVAQPDRWACAMPSDRPLPSGLAQAFEHMKQLPAPTHEPTPKPYTHWWRTSPGTVVGVPSDSAEPAPPGFAAEFVRTDGAVAEPAATEAQWTEWLPKRNSAPPIKGRVEARFRQGGTACQDAEWLRWNDGASSGFSPDWDIVAWRLIPQGAQS